MSLQVKNDLVRGTGFALLVVDQAISTALLSISVFSTFKRLFLGRSVPGKPNWTTAPTERFSAARISGDETSTTYCIGPDITTFIPEGDEVEIRSSDGSVHEKVAWEGVNIQVTWNGVGAWVTVNDIADGVFRWNWDPRAVAAAAATGAETLQTKDDELKIAQAEAAQKEKDQREAERLAEQQRKDEAAKRLKDEEDKKAALAKAAADAARTAAAAARAEELQRLALLAGKVALGAAAILGIAYLAYTYLNSPGPDREAAAFAEAQTCPARNACGVRSCTAAYHRDFPNGRHAADVTRIEQDGDTTCETNAFTNAQTCANRNACGVRDCTAAYHRDFPNGRHAADITRLENDRDAACPTTETALYNAAVACATDREANRRPCEVDSCFRDLRARFPATRLLTAEQARLNRNAADCSAQQQELAVFNAANACTTNTPCNTSCFNDYRTRYPNGQYRSQMDGAVARARQACLALTPPPPQPQPQPQPPQTQPPLQPPVDLNHLRPRRPTDNPSITCPGDNTPAVQIICRDGDIANMDGLLGQAFRDKLNRLNPQAQGPFRQDERNWITERDHDCGIPASGILSDAQILQLKPCVFEKTRQRKNLLAN